MRDGKVLKPGVDLNVGQYLLIFSIMYRVGAAAPPKIIYDFSPKITNIPITEILPTINIPRTTDDATEDVSSVEKEMGDLESEVEQKPQTETPTLNDINAKITLASPSVEEETPTPASPPVEEETPTLNDISAKITFVSPSVEQETPPVQTTLNDISAKITFVSPSVEQATPTLDNVQTQVELVTPVIAKATPSATYEYGLVSPNIAHVGSDGVKTYDECRDAAEQKGHLAWGMQSQAHPDVGPDKVGWCWSVADLNHYNKLVGSLDENDAHVQGCVDRSKKVSDFCGVRPPAPTPTLGNIRERVKL